MRTGLVLGLCVILSSGGLVRAGEPVPVVAVFSIEDRAGKLKRNTRAQLTEYLTTRMGEGDKFRVVPPSDLRARLAAQKKASFKKCFDEKCQIELGRELAANMTLSARLLRLGGRCQLVLNLYDLKKAATAGSASVRTGCGERDLVDAIDTALVRLGALSPGMIQTRPGSGAAPVRGGARPRKGACPPGMIKAGAGCCWPGQDWGASSQRCLGKPRCPDGYLAKADGCVPGCAGGKVLVAGHCCWPGQDWGQRKRRCIGEPTSCPEGTRKVSGDCRSLSQREIRDACRKSAFDPCVERCKQEHPREEFVRKCYLERVLSCRKSGKEPYKCGGTEAECDKLCADDPSPGTCSNICMTLARKTLSRCDKAWQRHCPELPACKQALDDCIGR